MIDRLFSWTFASFVFLLKGGCVGGWGVDVWMVGELVGRSAGRLINRSVGLFIRAGVPQSEKRVKNAIWFLFCFNFGTWKMEWKTIWKTREKRVNNEWKNCEKNQHGKHKETHVFRHVDFFHFCFIDFWLIFHSFFRRFSSVFHIVFHGMFFCQGWFFFTISFCLPALADKYNQKDGRWNCNLWPCQIFDLATVRGAG